MLIDPGHGGKDSGCAVGTTLEKNLVLDYALSLGHFAKNGGKTVRYTRTTDKFIDLDVRSRMVMPGEILISCHINATGSPQANGASVWYHGGQLESYNLAACIFKRIMTTHLFKKYGGGVISDLTRYNRGFAVLRGAAEIGAKAAVLLEPGFLSNAADRKTLLVPKNRIVLADAVYDGLCDYLVLPKARATDAE